MATILIVDDDADNREVLGRFLSRDGHEIVCASEGKSAIEMLSSQNPALVILDIRMPGMDGIEFLRVIRSYRRWRTLPVIVLSGLPDEDRERAAPHGVRHVLHKGSLDFESMRRIVREAAVSPVSPLPPA